MAVKNKVQNKQTKKTNVTKNTAVKKTTKPVAKKAYKKTAKVSCTCNEPCKPIKVTVASVEVKEVKKSFWTKVKEFFGF